MNLCDILRRIVADVYRGKELDASWALLQSTWDTEDVRHGASWVKVNYFFTGAGVLLVYEYTDIAEAMVSPGGQ